MRNGNYLTNKIIPATTLKLCADGQYLYQSNKTGQNKSLFAKQTLTPNPFDNNRRSSFKWNRFYKHYYNFIKPCFIHNSLLQYNIHSLAATSTISAYCNPTATGIIEVAAEKMSDFSIYILIRWKTFWELTLKIKLNRSRSK